MWLRIFFTLGAYEVLTIGLLQVSYLPDSIVRILEDFPVVGLVIFTLYYVTKMQREDNDRNRAWLEKMLEIQRVSLREVYDNQQAFLTALLSEITAKQNTLANRVELLTQQMAVNTSTVSEIAKVDTIVGDLIARLEQK